MKTRTLLLTACLSLAVSGIPLASSAANAVDPDHIYSPEEVDSRPEVVKVKQPQYPAELAGSGKSGMVAVRVVIDQMGDIEDIQVMKASDAAFGQAALDCVRHWSFVPGNLGGRNVKVQMTFPVRFQEEAKAVAKN